MEKKQRPQCEERVLRTSTETSCCSPAGAVAEPIEELGCSYRATCDIHLRSEIILSKHFKNFGPTRKASQQASRTETKKGSDAARAAPNFPRGMNAASNIATSNTSPPREHVWQGNPLHSEGAALPRTQPISSTSALPLQQQNAKHRMPGPNNSLWAGGSIHVAPETAPTNNVKDNEFRVCAPRNTDTICTTTTKRLDAKHWIDVSDLWMIGLACGTQATSTT